MAHWLDYSFLKWGVVILLGNFKKNLCPWDYNIVWKYVDMKKGAIAMEMKAVIMECETKRPCEKKVTSG